ncbi:tachykinins isoform X2 [Scaptodrosophila lebanonensis]|uniref:Tachykinins isoform X2 n=1 Tax=Drosophila lebanonensis TaxID=7225 RepID=A0A6J2TGN4_DROLE|nr:tachykinins isoform X2 [Scaptodrosophila lebanonensis]
MHNRHQALTTAGSMLLMLLLLLTAYTGTVEGDFAVAPTVKPTEAAAEVEAMEPQPLRKLVKRAPTSSFIGMRGKKDLQAEDDDSSGSSNNNNINWQQQLDPMSLDYADDNYYLENGRFKKAPLAFVGVRGKKYTPGSSRLGELLQSMEEQRFRENLMHEIMERLALENGEVVKRAPTGFTGMRGKRTFMDADVFGDADESALQKLEKRAPVNAFVGVRGKKDVSHQHYKRAALNEAYEARGKKQRYADFNSKFVAVRGKKSDEQAQDAEEDSDANYPPESRYLVQPFYPWETNMLGYEEKRVPNGFVGMRGKRSALPE